MSSSKKPRGVIAAGHELTASAGAEILREGGNAFDAALAALFASCVAEPVLASLGGGGFLLAHSNTGDSTLYDFFAHTPLGRIPEAESDFYPIVADFGTAQQEFHIGLGSIATPGVIKGLFEIHRDLCRLPLREIIQPASEAAKSGVTINAFQHYISEIVSPILKSSPQALALHQSPLNPGQLAACSDVVAHPAMADAFEALAYEGEELFYLGEMGRLLISACEQEGGYLRPEDLSAYRVMRRDPLKLGYHGTQLQTNPAPSVGGTLIAFTLALLEQHRLGGWKAGSHDHLFRVAKAQQLTQQLRQDRGVDRDLDADKAREILTEDYLQSYRDTLQNHPVCARGTTQISVADTDGNFASMTLSNGEGSGYVIPGTGIMMNNMLGEEDINPHGFHRWPLDRRIASMMSPTLVFAPEGRAIVTGSGGSNRIRSAILQVLINLIDFNMPIEEAVEHTRIHYEGGMLNLEAGPDQGVIDKLAQEFDSHRVWPQKNLFFGGAHSVMRDRDGSLGGQGDSRRGGVCLSV